MLAGPDLTPLEPATVIVTRGIITAVDQEPGPSLPADAVRLDVAGATVLPGLIDMHVHLGALELDASEEMSPTRLPGMVLDMVRHQAPTRRALVEHGVTTVRSLGDDLGYITELRRLVEENELEGPRVRCAGPLFTTPGGHPIVTSGLDPDSGGVRLPATADEARAMVRDLAIGPHPVDLIKVVQDRGSADRPLEPFGIEVLAAIVTEAHRQEMRVTTHWGTGADLAELVRVGVDGLEHVEAEDLLDAWPDEVLRQMVDSGVALTPTLAVTEAAVTVDQHRQLRARVAEFHAAGGRLLAGSDAGAPGGVSATVSCGSSSC